VEAADVAGNKSSGIVRFDLSRTPPTITANIPASLTSTLPNATLNVTGQIGAHSLSSSVMYVRQPSANGQCTSTGPLFGEGTTAGTVGQSTYQLGTSAQFTIPVILNGPALAQRPRVMDYCFQFGATGNEVNRLGNPNPTRSEQFYKLTYMWEVMPTSPGSIRGRVTVNTTSPLPGITVSSGPMSTTTDANGNYTLDPVDPGTRTVALGGLPADVQCNPSSKTTDVTSGQSSVLDFNCTRTNFVVALVMSYVHVSAGLSYSCVLFTANETAFSAREAGGTQAALTGATWSVTWSGPGVVGQTQRSGSMNTSNQALDRQQINLLGTYTANVSVSANGVTKQASGSVTVGGTQGTCPPP
jgi:hypothetical protein